MQTLAERIERDGPVNELDAVGWAIRLARRLEALHALGVFHGSVSPSCVVTEHGERSSRGRLADVRTTSSNVAYQSPERVLGGDLSAADDAWAVGAVLYMLLTGTSPFVGSSDDETKQKILAASPAPLAVFDVGDDDLQHVLDAAFTRDMSQRTSTVVGLRKKLEEWHPDPKVRQLAPLEDDEEVSTSEDDERTMLRPAPEIVARLNLGPSPRAAGSAPRAAGSAPRAAGSVPRAAGSVPRVAPSAPRAAPSAPRASPGSEVTPPAASARGSGRGGGAEPPRTAMAAYDFADPATPMVGQDAPIFAAAPEPQRMPLHAALAAALDPPTPEVKVEPAPPSPMLQQAPPPVAARAGMLPDPTDDDEEVKTVMREFPSNVGDAARAAIAGFAASGPPGAPPPPSSSPGFGFAPRAIGGATGDLPARPRPAAGRPALNQTSPMPALFSQARPGVGPQLGPPGNVPDPALEDDDVSDLQATVMREMPALPPEVARRLDAALGPMGAPPRPMWPTSPLLNDPHAAPGMPGPPGSMHGPPGSMHGAHASVQPAPGSMPGVGGFGPNQTGPMQQVAGGTPPPGVIGSPTAPSPPMAYGAPYSQTPPSNPLPTQAMPAWDSGHTAPLQPVPSLPGVNAPLDSGAGFPSPGTSLKGTQLMPPQSAWMQPPPTPGAFDTGRFGSDPFRQRGRGVTVAAIFALVLAAAVTFAVVRYLL